MKDKKQLPEYWFNGKPIKDDAALKRALFIKGMLTIRNNQTVYLFREDLVREPGMGFFVDDCLMADAVKVVVDNGFLGNPKPIRCIDSFDYEEWRSMTINGRKYTWNGGIKKLASLGVIEIRSHETIYQAKDDDYGYLTLDEPFDFLHEQGVFEYFDAYVESLPEDEYKKMAKRYDL